MFGYVVCISSYGERERSADPYGPWSESCENHFSSVHVAPKNGHPDIVTNLSIEPDEKCHVVWLEYSSGDSFGNGHRNHTVCLGVFKDQSAAKELAGIIRNHTDDDNGFGPSKWTLNVETSDGQYHKIYCSWLGYFEHLDEVHVTTTNMGA